MEPPGYFEQVRSRAAQTWVKLQDPELAGPWHRMLQQVESPRHVLSELLQNADDAGASWASARVIEDTFVFEHNGRDFSREEFASICRFGYSNKRALHTIGFRGVGFKSTFSLGDDVVLTTPTLAVTFSRSRFTEPIWSTEIAPTSLTTVRVQLTKQGRDSELKKNLNDWLTSSASLLFFRNIRTLQVNESELKWVECGKGPCPNSTWLKLDGTDQSPCLLVRSNPEPFPAEALEEIQAERILSDEEHLDMPPCTVELLLYGDSRLFVVLPTGVKTKLPFAANAPFVQDTARLKVKDPDSSPTNRWLLERIGKLAADSMLAWLSSPDTSPEFLAQAYDLMPNVDHQDSSLEGSCAATVEISFAAAMEGKKYVLTDANRLGAAGECLEVPTALMEVWSPSELGRILAQDNKAMASRHLSDASLRKLRDWQAILHIPRTQVVHRLKQVNPSRPQSWKQMLKLWSYLSEDIPSFEWGDNDLRGLRVVPVQGQQVLFAANDVIRLGEKRLLASDDDWTFMSGHLRAYNPNWSRFLADQRKVAERDGDVPSAMEVDRAYRLQNHLKLTESSDTNQVMRQVAADFYSAGQVAISDCVRLAHIGARLGASLGPEFRFVTKNNNLTRADRGVIADETGRIADIVPQSWGESHLLHDSYWSTSTSCTREDWLEWIESGKASLARFPSLTASPTTFWSKREFDAALESRGFTGNYETPYKTRHFQLSDSDFEPSLWEHWKQLAAKDERFWASLGELILDQAPAFWEKSLDAKAVQVATTGTKRQIVNSGIIPTWIRKLRDLPCLVDTRGIPRRPSEVTRRTAATEPLLDVEPFIPVGVDTEANRPLLKALNVRSTPTGPEQILERIRALAETDLPPIAEVEKWYRRLDGLFLNCTSEETKAIRQLFESEPLILSTQGWVRSQEVFLSAIADDVPDTPLIRPSVRDLELWRRIHVADRPNAELTLQWLRELPTGKPLAADAAKRVKPALARLGVTVWEQCGYWINLSNEWVPISEIKYSLSMRSLTKTQELFPAVKQATADFQMLDFESLDRYPFSDVPSLASRLDEQVSNQAVQAFVRREKPWLECLAKNLARIEVSSEVEQARLREAAVRLAQTEWRQGVGLETVPYLDGIPVGAARRVPAVWSGLGLYVAEASVAQMAAPVAREIARGFDHAGIGDAVKFCFERDPGFILDYLEQEFTLSKTLFDIPEQTSDVRHTSTESRVAEDPVVTQRAPAADGGAPDERQAESHQPEEQEPGSGQPPPPAPEPSRNPQPRDRPEKPSLIERFATAQGLRSDGNGKFIGSDNVVLLRSEDSVFPWELRRLHGNILHRLLPQEHCLEREPITVESDVWSLLHGAPETHALLVLSPDGTPTLLTGSEVKAHLDEGRFRLFPARYRLAKVT